MCEFSVCISEVLAWNIVIDLGHAKIINIQWPPVFFSPFLSSFCCAYERAGILRSVHVDNS